MSDAQKTGIVYCSHREWWKNEDGTILLGGNKANCDSCKDTVQKYCTLYNVI